jgi:hypothetical protein
MIKYNALLAACSNASNVQPAKTNPNLVSALFTEAVRL